MLLFNSKYRDMCKCERFGSYNEFYSECAFCDISDECLYFKNIQNINKKEINNNELIFLHEKSSIDLDYENYLYEKELENDLDYDSEKFNSDYIS